jgi:hypothetical protein
MLQRHARAWGAKKSNCYLSLTQKKKPILKNIEVGDKFTLSFRFALFFISAAKL